MGRFRSLGFGNTIPENPTALALKNGSKKLSRAWSLTSLRRPRKAITPIPWSKASGIAGSRPWARPRLDLSRSRPIRGSTVSTITRCPCSFPAGVRVHIRPGRPVVVWGVVPIGSVVRLDVDAVTANVGPDLVLGLGHGWACQGYKPASQDGEPHIILLGSRSQNA